MISHSKPYITELDLNAVKQQLSSGMISEGRKTEEFENCVSTYTGIKYCIATSSGTSAIELALHSLEIKKDDEIILPSYVCNSVYTAILNYGAKPVLCDIGDSWYMTPNDVKKVFSERTRAIILVQIFGINSWDNEWKNFNTPVIEDNCQAFGYEMNGEIAPLNGDISVYSFHATKCLTTGEGGMLATNDMENYERAKKCKLNLTPHCKMTDLQAALGISQLMQYDTMKEKRKEIAERYFNELPIDLLSNLLKIKNRSIFFRFPLNIKNISIEDCILKFKLKNIAVRRGVDSLLHRQYNLADSEFTNAVTTFNQTLSIPIYPALTDKEVNDIIEKVNEIL